MDCSGVAWDCFGVALGLLWSHVGILCDCFLVAFGLLWGCFGVAFGVALGLLWGLLWNYFGITLDCFCAGVVIFLGTILWFRSGQMKFASSRVANLSAATGDLCGGQ